MICINCHNQLKGKQTKYCSEKCQDNWYKKLRHPTTIICRNCGKQETKAMSYHGTISNLCTTCNKIQKHDRMQKIVVCKTIDYDIRALEKIHNFTLKHNRPPYITDLRITRNSIVRLERDCLIDITVARVCLTMTGIKLLEGETCSSKRN